MLLLMAAICVVLVMTSCRRKSAHELQPVVGLHLTRCLSTEEGMACSKQEGGLNRVHFRAQDTTPSWFVSRRHRSGRRRREVVEVVVVVVVMVVVVVAVVVLVVAAAE